MFGNYLNTFNEIGSFLKEHINQIINFDTCSDILTDRKMKSHLQVLNNPIFINEGFYIFKNDSISRKFLKSIIDFSYIFYEDNNYTYSIETQVIGKLFSLPCFYQHLKLLPPKTQGHIYGGSNGYNEDECLVCHNSSIDKNLLFEKMIDISKNKYWINYKNFYNK